MLQEEFQDYEGAKKSYETAHTLNPSDGRVMNNLAALLEDNFADYDFAKECFEKAIVKMNRKVSL